jgi:hypothetical protein
VICLLGFFFFAPMLTLGADREESLNGKNSRDKQLESLIEAVKKRDQLIDNLRERVETLEKEVRSLRASSDVKPSPDGVSTPSQQSPEIHSSAGTGQEASPAPGATATSSSEKEEEERLAQATLERILIDRSAVIMSPWTLEIEPSLSYSHAALDRIIVNRAGNVLSERLRHDSLASTLALRLGLPWEFQIETRIPYNFEFETIAKPGIREFARDANGLGDIELAVTRQLMMERDWLPNLVGGIRWRTTTGEESDNGLSLGSGFNSLQFQLSGVKYRDPVAFFGGISYTAELPETKDGFYIDPGDTIGFNMGLAVALNPETSINFQWEHRFINQTTFDDVGLPGSSATPGLFRVGLSYALARNYFLDLGVGIGLTEDAPDMQATVAVPIRIPDIFSGRR